MNRKQLISGHCVHFLLSEIKAKNDNAETNNHENKIVNMCPISESNFESNVFNFILKIFAFNLHHKVKLLLFIYKLFQNEIAFALKSIRFCFLMTVIF